MKPRGEGYQETTVILASLADYEKAEILDALIVRNATLVARAGREGRRLLAA
jgi:hypothetical protein